MNATSGTARLAGLAYLALALSSYFGLICVPLARPDPAVLARMVSDSEFGFRVRFVSDLIAQVSTVFLVLLLYRLFEPVNRLLAASMAVLLLVSAPIAFIFSLGDAAAHFLLSGGAIMSEFSKAQLSALATAILNVHIQGVYAVEVFWGLWLLPFGLLVLKSGAIPRLLGVFLIIAGFAYIAHSFLSLLVPEQLPAEYQTATMAARALGELPVILWLLIMGARAPKGASAELA